MPTYKTKGFSASARSEGFTLIELLIGISIIAVLSVIALVSYQGIIQRGRDSTRIGDLKGLTIDLQEYYIKHKKYPTASQTSSSCTTANIDAFYTAMAESRKDIPVDPETKERYCYIPVNNGQGYRLLAKLENCNHPEKIAGSDCDEYNFSLVSEGLTLASVSPSTTPNPPAPAPQPPAPQPQPPAPAPNPPPPAPNPPPPPPAVSPTKRVFVTKTWTRGNIGGLTGANTFCTAQANQASLGGTWKAWLSDSQTSATQNIPTHNNGPYKLVDNATLVASNWDNLIDGTLSNKINKDQFGTLQEGIVTWTNTKINGTINNSNNTCDNWTSATGTTNTGHTGLSNNQWTQFGSDNCNTYKPIYCFEQ